MSYFKFVSSHINIDIDLKDKYVFIDGFSGCGKSLFVTELVEALTLQPELVSSDLDVFVIQAKAEIDLIRNTKSIIVCDEMLAPKVLDKTLGMNVYCIIVSRKNYKNLNFSYRCFYIAKRDEQGVMTIRPKYNLVKGIQPDKTFTIIIEDSAAGYTFIKNMVSSDIEVISAKGKSNIEDVAKILIKANKNVCIVADGGGIGSIMPGIKRLQRLAFNKVKVCFVLPECFEQVLAQSDYLNFSENVFDTFEPCYDNTEKYYECVVETASAGMPFEYKHNNQQLSDCWTVDCCKCSVNGNCKNQLPGSKINNVIHRTKYMCLTVFMD